jgi:hypothetical protein
MPCVEHSIVVLAVALQLGEDHEVLEGCEDSVERKGVGYFN